MNIRPMETLWKGYRFRSRTEARWAVFLESLGLRFEYEPEGLILESPLYRGPYLPDFMINGFPVPAGAEGKSIWLEVKGSRPTTEEQRKAAALCKMTNTVVLLAEGPPEAEREDILLFDPREGDKDQWEILLNSLARGELILSNIGSQDLVCAARTSRDLEAIHEGDSQVHLEFNRRYNAARGAFCYALGNTDGKTQITDRDISFHPRIRRAYDRARSARFEFGQTDKRWEE